MTPKTNTRRAGFSLLEIIVAVSILAILAGAMAVRTGGLLGKSKAARAVQLTETLNLACTAYHSDTGQLPLEYSGYQAQYRDLSAEQTAAGWDGPYIDGPFRVDGGTNPFGGGKAHLYNNLQANGWVSGFDLDGDGSLDVQSNGCMLYLNQVEEGDAQRFDSLIDKGIPGSWQDSGRVRYIAGSRIVLVLVYF